MIEKFYTDNREVIEVNKEWNMDFVGVCMRVKNIQNVRPIFLCITTATAKLLADSLVKYAEKVDDELEEIEKRMMEKKKKKEVSDE